MRIGLVDVDGHNYPNLPLMKLSAWHKRRGDHVEWYSPIISGHMDRVYLSKVFSFTPDYEAVIDADEVIRGGSGYCIEREGGKEVYHGERDRQLPPEVEHSYPDYSLYPEQTKNTGLRLPVQRLPAWLRLLPCSSQRGPPQREGCGSGGILDGARKDRDM